MSLHPDVAKALQSAHDLEATASEQWHKQEHVFTDGPGDLPKRWARVPDGVCPLLVHYSSHLSITCARGP